MIRQHTFPQRIGKLIEEYIIKEYKLLPNKRQQRFGYYDAYNSCGIFEIKAAKENNYFRISQKNHEFLKKADGYYVFIRYLLKNDDHALQISTNVVIQNKQIVRATTLEETTSKWLLDQRKKILYYKVKL